MPSFTVTDLMVDVLPAGVYACGAHNCTDGETGPNCQGISDCRQGGSGVCDDCTHSPSGCHGCSEEGGTGCKGCTGTDCDPCTETPSKECWGACTATDPPEGRSGRGATLAALRAELEERLLTRA